MAKKMNAFYAQSGGVTAVINASACGVIETARKHKDKIGKVYAGRNGIIGALTEDLIDTTRETDAAIAALADEVMAYPNVAALLAESQPPPDPAHAVLLPCILESGGQRLSLFTTRASFGTARDVTLEELTLELFYPADAATDAALRAHAAAT